MIFNFPAQTEDVLFSDIERVVESGTSQTTFYPLMASPSVARSLARTVGKVDYAREQRFYEIISRECWPAARTAVRARQRLDVQQARHGRGGRRPRMIDEYVVDYEEIPRHRQRRHHVFGQQPVREHVLG